MGMYKTKEEQDAYVAGRTDGEASGLAKGKEDILEKIKNAITTYDAQFYICEHGKVTYMVDSGATHIE